MQLATTKEKLRQVLNDAGKIGFVPTMGALHQGHISLVERAVRENQTVVTSIFVNPTQFNDVRDLERYPQTLDADIALLEKAGCHLVFAPSVNEVYPEPDRRKFDFGDLETVMEGKHRPGHFNGVAQVVSKLFEMVKPQKAYFGLKDFQQLAIIKALVKQLQLNVEIVPCPIVREENGLAMSSRNELLTPELRKNAALISQTLFGAKQHTARKSVRALEQWATETINNNPFLTVEYIEIVNSETLQATNSWDEKGTKIICAAVFCGKVRLIDNVVLN